MESNPCYLFQFFLLYKAWAGMETVLEFVSLYYEQQINITVLSPPKYCVMPTRRVCQSLHKGANSWTTPWITLYYPALNENIFYLLSQILILTQEQQVWWYGQYPHYPRLNFEFDETILNWHCDCILATLFELCWPLQ